MRLGAKGECRSQADIRILSCPSPLATIFKMAWRIIYGRSTPRYIYTTIQRAGHDRGRACTWWSFSGASDSGC